MKTCKRLSAVLFLFFNFSIYCFAQSDFQKGYIVTNDLDTISGLIDHSVPRSNTKYCYFRGSPSSKVIKYFPDDLAGYGFDDNNQYVSKMIYFREDSSRVFLEYLVNGIVDLYYYPFAGHNYYLQKEGKLYLLSNDEVVIERGNTKYVADKPIYIDRLNWLMSDSDLSEERIENVFFTHNSLADLTKEYHENVCDYEDCIVYYKPTSKLNNARWRLNFGISAGMTWTSYTIENHLVKTSDLVQKPDIVTKYRYELNEPVISSNTNTVLPGFYFELSRNRRLSFLMEVQYSKANYANVELEQVYVPITFNYNILLYKKIVPYINFGLAIAIPVSNSFSDYDLSISETESVYDVSITPPHLQLKPGYPVSTDFVETLDQSQSIIESGGLLTLLGAGAKYHFTNRFILKFEIRKTSALKEVYSNDSQTTPIETDIKLKNIYAIMGLQFNIF